MKSVSTTIADACGLDKVIRRIKTHTGWPLARFKKELARVMEEDREEIDRLVGNDGDSPQAEQSRHFAAVRILHDRVGAEAMIPKTDETPEDDSEVEVDDFD